MKEVKLLAVDVGTQSVKGSVINQHLAVLQRRKIPYQYETLEGGKVQIDITVIWRAFEQLLEELDTEGIIGISFSTLCPSLVMMDAVSGEALHPMILHLDRRSGLQTRRIAESFGTEPFRAITGNPPIPGGISVTSMLWLKDHIEAAGREDIVFGHGVSYFMKQLTGEFSIDPSNASFTGLYETVAYGDWNGELLEFTGIARNQLPKVIDSYASAGRVTPSAAGRLGLPAGIPVIIGANDTTCSLVGAGAVEPGMMLNTSGTVELIALCSDKPVIGSNHLLRTHALRDRWILMRTLGAGGASVEWFRQQFCREISREQFCREISREEFYRDIYDPVLQSHHESVVFAPYLTGDRQSLDERTASFTNITLSSTREDFLYAIAVNNIRYQISIMKEWEQVIPLSKELYHVGGGSSTAYTNLKQRMLPEYTFIESGETAEIGAAVIGFETLGFRLNTCDAGIMK